MTHGADDPPPAGPDETLRDIAGQLPAFREEVRDLRDEVRKERRKRKNVTAMLAVVVAVLALALGVATYEGAQHDVQTDHNLCVRLTQSRADLFPVWERVLSGRPDAAALLARVKAAEPVGKCPGSPAAGN
jgi:Tfp pilus assembly protein PilN